jgi:hypothetical protein
MLTMASLVGSKFYLPLGFDEASMEMLLICVGLRKVYQAWRKIEMAASVPVDDLLK